MEARQSDLKRPIRVVLFCGGPTLDRAVVRFVSMLEEHPEIEFLGGVCQSNGQTFIARVRDLWKRRGVLSLPLLFLDALNWLSRYLVHPLSELKQRKKVTQICGQIQFVPDIHAEHVLERIRSLSPDLGLIYGAPILKPKLFDVPAFGTLGIHHGKVPEYRGKKTTFWAIFNGEKTAGVTIQRVNAGLDSGDVVKQGEVRIGSRSLREVWKDLELLGFDLYVQAIVAIKRGTAQFHPQVGKKGKLYRDPRVTDIVRFYLKQLKRRLLWNYGLSS